MNKQILSIAAALLAMAAVTFTSCKKDDDDNNTVTPAQTNQQKIVGTWLRTGDGVDNNGNGVLDASERTAPT